MRSDMNDVEDEPMRFMMVGLGAVLGANARYLVTGWAADRFGGGFPYGTLIVNLTGSFLIGFFLTLIAERVAAHPYWRPFFAVGFLGAYTTFSAYTYESAQLLAGGAPFRAAANLAGSVVLGMLSVAGGIALARQL